MVPVLMVFGGMIPSGALERQVNWVFAQKKRVLDVLEKSSREVKKNLGAEGVGNPGRRFSFDRYRLHARNEFAQQSLHAWSTILSLQVSNYGGVFDPGADVLTVMHTSSFPQQVAVCEEHQQALSKTTILEHPAGKFIQDLVSRLATHPKVTRVIGLVHATEMQLAQLDEFESRYQHLMQHIGADQGQNSESGKSGAVPGAETSFVSGPGLPCMQRELAVFTGILAGLQDVSVGFLKKVAAEPTSPETKFFSDFFNRCAAVPTGMGAPLSPEIPDSAPKPDFCAQTGQFLEELVDFELSDKNEVARSIELPKMYIVLESLVSLRTPCQMPF